MRPTVERRRFSLEKRERAAAKADDSTRDVVERINEVIAYWDKNSPNNTIEYTLPCGSRFKIVCLGTARNQIAMAEKKGARK